MKRKVIGNKEVIVTKAHLEWAEIWWTAWLMMTLPNSWGSWLSRRWKSAVCNHQRHSQDCCAISLLLCRTEWESKLATSKALSGWPRGTCLSEKTSCGEDRHLILNYLSKKLCRKAHEHAEIVNKLEDFTERAIKIIRRYDFHSVRCGIMFQFPRRSAGFPNDFGSA